MKICTKEAHFRFGGLYFDQIDGVAMGSPLANLFMSHYENKVFDQLKQLGIEFWYRYVDDTFVILKDKKNSDLVQFLNNIHKNLRFTTENEKNKMILFLDVLVERKFRF
jgi:hypothetical protein